MSTALPLFAQWAKGFSGCDGGDIGSPERPAIWLSGIEWGGTREIACIRSSMTQDVSKPALGYPNWAHNDAYRFNKQVSKLLAVIAGYELAQYRNFLAQHQPFTQQPGNGYFKLNLFPIAFKSTSHSHWSQEMASITGLLDKKAYLDWCQTHRLPALRAQAALHRPKLIICLGKSYVEYFKTAFLAHDGIHMERKSVGGHEILWKRNTEGTLVVVLPFMLNRNGLVRHLSITQVGQHIAQLLRESLPTGISPA